MARKYSSLENSGLTFAVDIQDSRVRIAVTACSTDDVFNSRTGKDIVDAMLDMHAPTLKVFQIKPYVIHFPLKEDLSEFTDPEQVILNQLLDYLDTEIIERIFFRRLYDYFNAGVTSADIASNECLADFQELLSVLTPESREQFSELTSVEELYSLFFFWQGSFKHIYRQMKKFASAVHTGNMKFAKPRIAPRIEAEEESAEEPQRFIAAKPKITN